MSQGLKYQAGKGGSLEQSQLPAAQLQGTGRGHLVTGLPSISWLINGAWLQTPKQLIYCKFY